MSRNRNLTHRISIRCTERESYNIRKLANEYNMTVTNLIRHSIVIAITRATTEHRMRNAVFNAYGRAAGRNPWSTS